MFAILHEVRLFNGIQAKLRVTELRLLRNFGTDTSWSCMCLVE